MGLFVSQEDRRSELQKRIAAELQEKAKKKAAADENERPDLVDDSAYLEGYTKATPVRWGLIGLVILVIVILYLFFKH